LRKAYAAGCYVARLAPPVWRAGVTSKVILNFHYFTSSEPSSYLEIRVATLRAQLNTILAHFHVAPLVAEALDCTPRSAVSISVDDADVSLLEALPIFETLGVPITVFAPVGLCMGPTTLDGLRSWTLRHWLDLVSPEPPFDVPPRIFFEQVMDMSEGVLGTTLARLKTCKRRPEVISSRVLLTINQLQEVTQRSNTTLAAHSMSHARLADLPPNWLNWEVEQSLGNIERLGGSTEVFAYPYGALGTFSAETNAALKAHGVRHALSTLAMPVPAGRKPFVLGRTGMLDSSWSAFVRGSAGGAFEWWDRIRYGQQITGDHGLLPTQ
jgi:peptidoglycan/xylan/chitin deacetylase (PgdA/CDA1 family)